MASSMFSPIIMFIIRSFFRSGPDLIIGPGAVFGGVMNYITFNQDFSQVAVASRTGFRVYSTEPFSKKYQNNEGDVGMVEMLFSTTLVALVLSPRFLRIMNTQRGTTICDLTFPSKINAMRMNRKRMIVVLEGAIYIYDIGNMKLLHQIDTPPNPLGKPPTYMTTSMENEGDYVVLTTHEPFVRMTAPG